MKRPPVEELPAERPRCAWCDRPLGYWTTEERTKEPPTRVVRRVFRGWKGYPTGGAVPIFDKLQCALEAACDSHAAGYRWTR